MNDEDLINLTSAYSVDTTLNRLTERVKAKGITVFARIDHAAGAHKVGAELRPTQVLIFGNPNAGTPLMQDTQAIALDLPLKVLAYEDAAGSVNVVYRDMHRLASAYGLEDGTMTAVNKAAKALASLVQSAVQAD